MELRLDNAAAWFLEQSRHFLAAGFAPVGVNGARPGRHAYRLSRPGGWSVAADQAHAGDWGVAVLFGASAAAPYGPDSEPADSQAREQARWTRGIFWTDDPAGALAVARAAADLEFSGPQVHEGQRGFSMARRAALHPGAGRRGYAGAGAPRNQGQVGDVYQRRRRRRLEGRE